MNLKIKIYCILLTIVYLAIIGSTVYNGRADFIEGMKDGARHKTESSYNIEMFSVNVMPENTKYSFPEIVKNKKNNQDIQAKVSRYGIKMEMPTKSFPVYLRIINILFWVIFPFLLIGLLLSPFLFFSIIYSVSKNGIINNRLIIRTQILGWFIVSFSAFDFFYRINKTMIFKYSVELHNYNIEMDELDYMMLVLGLVTLLLAEILKVSLKMKEEQDLTI